MIKRSMALCVALALVALCLAPLSASAKTLSKSGGSDNCYASVTFAPGSGYSTPDYIYSMYGSQGSGTTLYRRMQCTVVSQGVGTRYNQSSGTVHTTALKHTWTIGVSVSNVWNSESIDYYKSSSGTPAYFNGLGWNETSLN
jgi:hypothetical protein